MKNKKLLITAYVLVAVLAIVSVIGLLNSTVTVTVELPGAQQAGISADTSKSGSGAQNPDSESLPDGTPADAPAVTGNAAEAPSDGGSADVTEAPRQTQSEAKDSSGTEQTTEKAPGKTPVSEKPTASRQTEKPSSDKSAMSKEQAVELYNKAANRIKKESSSITRNYKKLSSADKYLKLPSAIQGIGSAAMKQFVKGSDKAETYTKQEDKNLVFPVGGTDYTSHLTADMVKSASVTDNGSAYKVSLVLYDDKITSPEKGKGYAGVFNTVTASTFSDINIPTVTFEKVNVNGIGGEINCTIDKASGRISDIIFKNTDILDLSVKVAIKTLDVRMALASEESFSVKY